jgi:hypothetical protein
METDLSILNIKRSRVKITAAGFCETPILERFVRESEESDSRMILNNVIAYAVPSDEDKDRIRIFEIAKRKGDWSRVTEVNKNTGHEHWGHSTNYFGNVESVEKYLMKSIGEFI